MRSEPRRRFRAGLLSAVVVALPTLGSAVTMGLALRTGRDALDVADPAGVLMALASLALAGVLAWAGAAAAAGVADAWTTAGDTAGTTTAGTTAVGNSPSPRGRTGAVSAGVAALVVAALTAPGAAAASGSAGPPDVVCVQPAGAAEAPVAVDPDGTPEPSTPSPEVAAAGPGPGSWSALADDGFRAPRGASAGSTALVTAPPSRQAATGGAAQEVVVLAGDSLWSIAERHLGPGADAVEVAEAWPRWWHTNRSVVGDDPDLLLPGQRLVVPTP